MLCRRRECSAMRPLRLAKRHPGTAALIIVGIGFLALSTFLGTFRPFLVVQGTSMEPVYHRGDLLLLQDVPANEIVSGDILVFAVPEDAQVRLKMPPDAAHRVIESTNEGGRLTSQLRPRPTSALCVPSRNSPTARPWEASWCHV